MKPKMATLHKELRLKVMKNYKERNGVMITQVIKSSLEIKKWLKVKISRKISTKITYCCKSGHFWRKNSNIWKISTIKEWLLYMRHFLVIFQQCDWHFYFCFRKFRNSFQNLTKRVEQFTHKTIFRCYGSPHFTWSFGSSRQRKTQGTYWLSHNLPTKP